MREIKFRGKSTKTELHTAQWRFGSFRAPSNEACKPLIFVHFSHPTHDGNGYWYEVEADTVGQFTGLKDCKGQEIFEGDIVKCDSGRICKVVFFTSACACCFDLIPVGGFDCEPPKESTLWKALTVIGNIYDNPELLEVEA